MATSLIGKATFYKDNRPSEWSALRPKLRTSVHFIGPVKD